MNFCEQLLIKLYQNFKSSSFNPFNAKFEEMVNKKTRNALAHLVRKGYLKREKVKEYSLTQKGKGKVRELLVRNKELNKKWDGKWRVVIFDVPETKRRFRSYVRKILFHLNFIRLQRSVWITPYDVFDELIVLLPSVKRGDWIKILIVESISNEDKLKKEFKLTR